MKEEVVGGLGLFTIQAKSFWLDVEEETAESNNSIDCNFKTFMGYTFMTSTKMSNSVTPSETPSIRKNGQ